MPLRPPAGFIRPGYDPLKVPDAPTGASATGGDESASVSFTPPSNTGGSAVSAYYAVSNPGQFTGTGSSSPVSVTGLTNGTSYTFTVWALNTYGPSPYSAASGSVTPAQPQRVVYAGGYATGFDNTNVIGYIDISTTGNATDFGDLTTTLAFYNSACSSSTRGIFAGGYNGGSTGTNIIQYVTMSSTGNAVDFGDFRSVSTNAGTGYAQWQGSGVSNSTRGIFTRAKARNDGNSTNYIDYITIATLGNSVYFGDIVDPSSGSPQYTASAGSSTRGVIAKGNANNILQYITIATTGNATDFGDLTYSPNAGLGASGSSTRAIFAGGGNSNTINYITIASTGNATYFGDLSTPRNGIASSSNATKSVFMGGYDTSISGIINVIEQVTIASVGNSTDFGDLTQITYGFSACSDGHGGLQ